MSQVLQHIYVFVRIRPEGPSHIYIYIQTNGIYCQMGDYMATYHLLQRTMFHMIPLKFALQNGQVFTIESPGLSSTSDLASVEGKPPQMGAWE